MVDAVLLEESQGNPLLEGGISEYLKEAGQASGGTSCGGNSQFAGSMPRKTHSGIHCLSLLFKK